MSDNEFSVCQFFTDGSYEYVRRFVTVDEAFKAVKHYTNNVAIKMGLIEKVIITDGGDSTVFEWTHKDGVVWPKEEKKDGRHTV
jgi:hypothetical protein